MILGRGHHVLTSILPLPQVIGAEDPPHPCPGQGIRSSRQFRAQHGPPTPQLSPGLRELPGSGSHPGHPPHGARGPWARWCLHTPQGARAPVLVPWVYEASMEEGHRPQVRVPEASHAPQNVETRPHARVPRSPLRSPWQRAGNERRLSRLLAGCGENPRVAPGTAALANARRGSSWALAPSLWPSVHRAGQGQRVTRAGWQIPVGPGSQSHGGTYEGARSHLRMCRALSPAAGHPQVHPGPRTTGSPKFCSVCFPQRATLWS